MSVIPKLNTHNQKPSKFDSAVDAYIFINPDTNEEYIIIGAGVLVDEPLIGSNTYANVAEHLNTPAKLFGFIPTTRLHRYEANDEFVPDYVVPFTDPIANLFGVTEVAAMRIK